MPARGPKIAEAYVEVHADMDSIPGEIRRGVDKDSGSFQDSGDRAGTKFGDGFTEGSSRTISRDSSGRFTRAGDSAGRTISKGVGDAVSRDGDSAGSSLARSVGRGAAREGPHIMATTGGSMMRSLSGGISGHTALVGTAIGGAFAAAPMIGALASAGIVSAFGAGLAGIGMVSAAQLHKVQGQWVIGNKKIAQAFETMGKKVHTIMQSISKPFQQTWVTIANVVTRTMQNIAPHLESMFKGIAPALSKFIDNLGYGFEKLMPGLSAISGAFVIFLDTLGPAMPAIFTSISNGLIAVADAVSRNPEAIVRLIMGLVKLLEIGLRFIAWLTDVWGWMEKNIGLMITLATMAAPMAMGAFMFLVDGASLVGKAFAGIGSALSAAGAWIMSTASSISSWIGQKWQEVVNWTSTKWTQAVNWVTSKLSAIWNAAVNFGARVVQAISNAWNSAVQWTAQAWSRMVAGVNNSASNMMSTVSRIPGNILRALGNMGRLLFDAGRNVVSGLINGITSMFGSLGSTVSSMASRIRAFLPFSPAKEGPLSGMGAPEVSGRRIAENLAMGMRSGQGLVTSALGSLMGPVAQPALASGAPASGGGRGGVTISHLSIEMPVTLDITKGGAARAFLVELNDQLRRLQGEYA